MQRIIFFVGIALGFASSANAQCYSESYGGGGCYGGSFQASFYAPVPAPQVVAVPQVEMYAAPVFAAPAPAPMFAAPMRGRMKFKQTFKMRGRMRVGMGMGSCY